jgi:hypothetical protein
MSAEAAYASWAPAGRTWSLWVKPVLFAHLSSDLPEGEVALVPSLELGAAVARLPAPDRCLGLVLDLPGEAGVRAGLLLAERGYHPVPLYNAAPGAPALERVPVRSTLEALVAVTPALRLGALPERAPPAFLLDARRSGVAGRPDEGLFDNRSVCFPTDFPSAATLQRAGIQGMVLVQPEGTAPARDLSYTLELWQRAGLPISAISLQGEMTLTPIRVQRPSWYSWVWYRALTLMGLRRSELGGFGGYIEAALG